MTSMNADVIVVGAGLAGLVAAAELSDASRRVVIVDQEPDASLGGQAFWSFGGLFLVDSPEQRRLGIHDSRDLAMQDWVGAAGFDRAEDLWPRRWAEAYVDFAAGEKRSWLHAQGIRFFPVVGWAERGGSLATGHGNSVPRFHVTWGTGPAVVEPFVRRVRDGIAKGKITLVCRHRVNGITSTNGRIDGVQGDVLEPSRVERGVSSSRVVTGHFELRAQAVIVTSGGIGGNFDLVRENWPARIGKPPSRMLCGVPAHVDGRMLAITEQAGGRIINRDRMWHYTEGIENWNPIWPHHGIRILPGPSSLWLDALGRRLPAPLFPGFDTLATLEHILRTGFDYSWFVLTQKIIEKEFALSGSEQNPDLTGRSIPMVLKRALPGATAPVEAFKAHGVDFVVARTLAELVRGMNAITDEPRIDDAALEREIVARDSQLDNSFGKDAQLIAIRGARNYIGDKLIRVATPHRLLDPKAGPLIAVRLSILTRKTLGGLETDLSSRVLGGDGQPVPDSMRRGKLPDSVAVACMATDRSKARSLAAASSPVGLPAARPQWRCHDTRHASARLRSVMAENVAKSPNDELANSLTHGFGLVLSLVGGPLLIVTAAATSDPWRIVAACIYAATLVLLYAASTLYHSVRTDKLKEICQRIDHSSIYLLIAGTYTPFMLISLRGAWGWSIFGVVWGLAILGVVLKSSFGAKLPTLSTWIYLAMGWLIVIALRPLSLHVAPAGMWCLALGGAFYTGGVVFYVWERVRFSHAIWHLFVLGGSAAHFAAVLWYALPPARTG
jgi:channel protein (hemolysin III family)